MLWWVIALEAAAFAVLFTAIIFAYYRGDRKYSPASIHNYPPDIQEEYFKTHTRVDVSYQSKNVLLTKSLGVLIFTGILFVCAAIAGAVNQYFHLQDSPHAFRGSQGMQRFTRFI